MAGLADGAARSMDLMRERGWAGLARLERLAERPD
jgi:hypothetical protein